MKTLSKAKTRLVVCIDNTGYPVSLEPRKLYQVLRDDEASAHDQVRVVDESGEDYLYPASFFLELDLRPTGMRLPWKRVRDKPVRLFSRDAVLRSLRKAAEGSAKVRSKAK